ncbi:MAG: phosphotransferase [Lachnospiraceae bacterium]|nr:phosphotransferase [Lachnospiraceae bacterium]
MNDYCLSLLEQYDIEVLRTRKGRGAYIIDTPKGPLIFKEYIGPESRAAIQNRLLEQIREAGVVPVELLIPTKEDTFLVKDTDETGYILKTYPEGRELNIGDREECREAVRVLAKLHRNMILQELPEPADQYLSFQEKRYEKGCKELRRVRKYLLQRSQKSDFELSLLHHYGYFQEQADRVLEEWSRYSRLQERDPGAFCHGDYQYHNILLGDRGMIVVNFEKFVGDNQIRDLYLLLRKLLEKSSWSLSLGQELIEAYEQISPLSALSRIDLYYRLAYPEKFRKIVNFYYNSGKAWIPGRNQEKLDKIIEQEKEKQYFLEKVFQV